MRFREFTNIGLYGTYKYNSAPQQLFGDTSQVKEALFIGEEGHYGYPNFPPNSDVGGAFRLESNRRTLNPVGVGTIVPTGGADSNAYYTGSFTANAGMSQFGIGQHSPAPWGTDAYNRMKPTSPSLSGLNAIFELKDVPRLLMQRFESLKDIGSYWLALKFGWEPLLRDVRDFVNFQRNAQKRLKQLLRDNGRPVRRSITMQDDEVASATYGGSGYGFVYPTLITQFYSKTPVALIRISETDRVWASGTYKYWLPAGPRDVKWTRSMLSRIHGLHPSPSVVYNAIPWTWLIDWFFNVGNVIENLETGVADRLAASHFYVMREYRETATTEATMWFKRKSGEEFSVTSTCSVIRKSCERNKGNPFGFTVPNPLNGMQLSILGALGMSRL